MCKVCSKLKIKTPERHSVSLIFWTDFTYCFRVSIVNFEQVNSDWEAGKKLKHIHMSNVVVNVFKVTNRSSRQEAFWKKGVLIHFAKFTGKYLCQSLFVNKVEDVRSATLLKKRLCQRYFSVNFAKFLITPFF